MREWGWGIKEKEKKGGRRKDERRCLIYISIKIDPNGNIPPSSTSVPDSRNLHKHNLIHSSSSYHFFSGIGLGTVCTLQGTSACPIKLRPSIVPIKLSGNITNNTIPIMANCREEKRREKRGQGGEWREREKEVREGETNNNIYYLKLKWPQKPFTHSLIH